MSGTANTLLQLFKDGGAFMWPLLITSIIGLAVIIVKFVTLGIAQVKTRRLLKEVDAYMAEGKIEEAKELCENTPGPVAAILSSGLQRADEGSDRVIKAIENTGAIELSFLERGLVTLATIATVAPLLGFLGTVARMIQAFGAIELAGEVNATLVAGGIKVALITTAGGLAIAIPVNIFHNYFVTRVDRLILDMEESSQNIIEAIHQREVAGK